MSQANVFKELLMDINRNNRRRAREQKRKNDSHGIFYTLDEREISAQTVPAKRTTLIMKVDKVGRLIRCTSHETSELLVVSLSLNIKLLLRRLPWKTDLMPLRGHRVLA